MKTLEPALRQGLSDLALDLSANQVASLLAYLALIQKWNKVYNLTAVRDPFDMLTHHLLDSLALIAPLRLHLACSQAEPAGDIRLLDVGSGAGLPGVVVAICCPNLKVDCVDTVGKKAAFIQQVAVSLNLGNLRGVHARVENLTDRYSVITSRAFASLLDFTSWSVKALAEQGVWLAMKGKHPADELAALPATINVFHVEPLAVPGLAAERCLVWMRQAGAIQSGVS
jgi:16S rRNA (guanine527-N7)-methyltransferase